MLAHLTFCRGWLKKSVKSVVSCVKIGKNSARNQSKALIPQSKNQIFQKFLSSFTKTSYERRATRNGYIFVSNVQLRLIIEGVFFYSLSLPEFIRVYPSLSPVVLTRLFCRGVCAYLLVCRGSGATFFPSD